MTHRVAVSRTWELSKDNTPTPMTGSITGTISVFTLFASSSKSLLAILEKDWGCSALYLWSYPSLGQSGSPAGWEVRLSEALWD